MVPDLVGLGEIADMLGVQHETAHRWRSRHLLPQPDMTISGKPLWRRNTIVKWAKKTGRWERVTVGPSQED